MSAISPKSINQDILPYELWLQCLKLAVMNSADGPLPYLAVSTHWRDMIIQSPTLWASVIIDGDRDELARIHTFLDLSADQLLDVEVVFSETGDYGEAALRLVLRDTSRIRSITTHALIGTRQLRMLVNTLVKSTVFTQLNELAIGWPWLRDEEISDLLSLCPNIRLMGSRHHQISREGLIPEKVKTLHLLGVSLQENYDLVRRNEVEYLDLGYSEPQSAKDALIKVPLQDNPDKKEYLGVQRMRELTTGIGRQLKQLRITFDLILASQFVSFIPSLVNLRDLDMGILFGTGRTPTMISSHRLVAEDMKNLRLFKLSGYAGDSEAQFQEDMEGFLRIFTDYRAMEYLEVLNIFSQQSLNYSCLTSIIRSAVNIRSLHITITEPLKPLSLTKGPVLKLPKLLYMWINPGVLLDFIPIKAPKIISIHIEGMSHSPKGVCCQGRLSRIECSTPETLRAIAQSSSARSVEIMTIRSASASTALVTFSYIHKLEMLVDRTFEESYRGTGVNELLLELLCQPEALPCLRILRSNRLPFWELLFEVFRHRNSSKVARLSTLGLPLFPAFPILYRLVAFLQGQSNIYTTRDFDKVIYHRWLSRQSWYVCYCLLAGHIYCSDSSSTFLPQEIARLELLDLVHMDLQSETEDFRIRDWNHWQRLLQNKELQIATLSIHDFGKKCRSKELVDITQYTLHA